MLSGNLTLNASTMTAPLMAGARAFLFGSNK